jgi:hypothetical protein
MDGTARQDWRDPAAPLDYRITAARASVARHLLEIALLDPFWESITVRYAPEGEIVFTNLADYSAEARHDAVVGHALLEAVAEEIDFLRSHGADDFGAPTVAASVTVYRDSGLLEDAA